MRPETSSYCSCYFCCVNKRVCLRGGGTLLLLAGSRRMSVSVAEKTFSSANVRDAMAASLGWCVVDSRPSGSRRQARASAGLFPHRPEHSEVSAS